MIYDGINRVEDLLIEAIDARSGERAREKAEAELVKAFVHAGASVRPRRIVQPKWTLN
jgi:hypothetical protein